MSAPKHQPPGFVPLDAVEFRNGYAVFAQSLRGELPADPTFPTRAVDAATGKEIPLPDTPSTRAAYAASKRFTDDAKRASFLFRLQMLMPLAVDRRYSRYRNDQTGTMHIALITAVAAAPCTARMTRKELQASLEAAFRVSLPLVEVPDRKH
jgi:hypothetical protein